MSKNIQTPKILRKDDAIRQQEQKTKSNQPKILTKTKENVTVIQNKPAIQIKKDPEGSSEVPSMKSSHCFMHPHFNIDQKLFEYLDNENSDFLVVAAIGSRNVGKSTLMNIIADQKYVKVESDGSFKPFKSEHEIFNTKVSQNYEGSTIDMFITTDRIIVLDPSPISSNVQRRDMIVAESDDLKMLLMLFQLCHLIVVVHNGFPDLSILRLINLAEMIILSEIKHRPKLIYVGNCMQPGTKPMKLDPRIHSGCNLMIPDFHHRSLKLHHDISKVIQDYQEKIFMLRRFSMLNDEEEIFTEKKWSLRVLQVVESLKGDYFLRKYDGLRDKYHQQVD